VIERHYPAGPDHRAMLALRRQRESTGQEPPRLKTVVCGRNHVLARIVRTQEGPVITGKGRPETILFGDDDRQRVFGRSRSTEVAVLLDLLSDNQAVNLQCRCRHENVRASWIRACLAAPGHTAVYAVR